VSDALRPRSAKEQLDAIKGPLTKDNYREVAAAAIQKYAEQGKPIDSLLWSAIIGFYNDALEEALKGSGK
jgi:hypothetical protein